MHKGKQNLDTGQEEEESKGGKRREEEGKGRGQLNILYSEISII